MMLAAVDDGSVTAVIELPAGWRLFFNTSAARDRATQVLAERWPGSVSLGAIDVSDEDWARRSQEDLRAVQVGRVRISPPWAAGEGRASGHVPLKPDASYDAEVPRGVRLQPDETIEVVIQPSMGFGTGHHATTRLCTALLQQLDLSGRSVLDIGTGSGVLALVALRLGASGVLGVDDDADALASARENLELNGVTSGIELVQADFRKLSGQTFDVVTANLTGGVLVRGAEHVLSTLAEGASLILSGITLEEEADVRARFDSARQLAARLAEDGWVGLRYGR